MGALCAVVALGISQLDTFLGAEWLLHDTFTRSIAARRDPDPQVVIVAVSDEAIRNLAAVGFGRPPYSREVYAEVIRELRRAGAAVIAFDIAFPEEDLSHPEGDREFAKALGEPGAPVILAADTGANFPSTNGGPFAHALWQIDGAPDPVGALLPLPAFATAAGIGTIHLASTRSAVIHRYRLADRVHGAFIASLALESARAFLHLPRMGQWKSDRFDFGPMRIPIDAQGTFAIRWQRRYDQRDAAIFISLDKVIVATDPVGAGLSPEKLAAFERQFQNKIVLIGYTGLGVPDQRATPLSAFAAGLEIHANAISNLVRGTFNRDARPTSFALLVLAIAALVGAVIHGTRSQWWSAAIAVGTLAAWIAAGYVALTRGIIVHAVSGATSILLTYVAVTVIKFTAEQRQTAVLRATFGRYVSPQILDHILAHPESVHLGGERRDLTILFSDIRGFTTISEASEPEIVVEMLNEYLTRMVEILLEHGGTLDKFIGDAVMGFWNAPARDPDHPRHAVQCAIVMIEETARLRAQWEAAGKPAIRIGIGINTGDAVVGNIGAEKVFGYTVIGDAVNLASRLEGKNKDYGTEIIISEFTKARIGDGFETVYLDEVKVKGKEQAVRIYELKGRVHA